MRIAIASLDGGGLNDMVSQQFGRCPAFTIVDVINSKIANVRVVPNPAANAPRGAGVQAAQLMINEGVNVVIAGNFGPNAALLLSQSGILMIPLAGVRVEEAIKMYIEGRVQPLREPYAGPGRPGFGRGFGRGRGGKGRGYGGRGKGQW